MLDPEILFLDEPFAGVNPFLRDEIIVLVRKLHADGRTFVIVDHDIEALQRLVHRMVVMSRGSKIADGTVAEVRETRRCCGPMPVSDAAPVLTARNLVAGYLPGINILNGMSVDVHARPGALRARTERHRQIDAAEGAVRLPAGAAGRDASRRDVAEGRRPRTTWAVTASPICRSGRACFRSCPSR